MIAKFIKVTKHSIYIYKHYLFKHIKILIFNTLNRLICIFNLIKIKCFYKNILPYLFMIKSFITFTNVKQQTILQM